MPSLYNQSAIKTEAEAIIWVTSLWEYGLLWDFEQSPRVGLAKHDLHEAFMQQLEVSFEQAKVVSNTGMLNGVANKLASKDNDVYVANGYSCRDDYLRALAEDYGINYRTVRVIADLMGPEEDFDGLVCSLEDLEDAEGDY